MQMQQDTILHTQMASPDTVMPSAVSHDTVRYSDRPDTLHLPGHGVGHSFFDADLPTYYRENFFSDSPMLHPELDGGRFGMAGDPIPYTLRGDSVISMVLVVCFVMVLIAFRMSYGFIYRQAKDFFYIQKSGPTYSEETASEIRFQFFLVVQGSLMLSIFQYQYVQTYVADTFILDSQYQLMAIYLAVILGFLIVKHLLYTVVNTVFFDEQQQRQWRRSMLFLLAAGGVLVAPAVLLLVYFDLELHKAVIYLLAMLILVEILVFYKSYVIFFGKISAFLQFFLYFCALEIVPLLSLWGGLLLISNCLKVNY